MLCATFEGHFRTQIIKMGPPNPASLSPGNSVVEPRNLLMSPQVILMLTKVRRNELRDGQGHLFRARVSCSHQCTSAWERAQYTTGPLTVRTEATNK